MSYYVYAHFTKDTNELFYIGVGTGRRAYKASNSDRNEYWHRIVNKHGYTVEIVLEGFSNRDDAVKEEVRLQVLNKPRACLQYGDKLNRVVTDQARANMRAGQVAMKSNSGRYKKGQKQSLEIELKRKKAIKEYYTANPMKIHNSEFNNIVELDKTMYQKDIASIYGVSRSTIKTILRKCRVSNN